MTEGVSFTRVSRCHDEFRILIFDDSAENERGQRPLRESKLSNPHARAARAACMEKIYEISRARAARGAMRWLPTKQVYSIGLQPSRLYRLYCSGSMTHLVLRGPDDTAAGCVNGEELVIGRQARHGRRSPSFCRPSCLIPQ